MAGVEPAFTRTVIAPVERFLLTTRFASIPTTCVPAPGASVTVAMPDAVTIGPLHTPPATAIGAPPSREKRNGFPAIPCAADSQTSIAPVLGVAAVPAVASERGSILRAAAGTDITKLPTSNAVSEAANHERDFLSRTTRRTIPPQ